jgi:hypothetical protein
LHQEEWKKMYKEIEALNFDTSKLVRPDNRLLSNKELNHFIETGLEFIHKKFHLNKKSLDDFLSNKGKQEEIFIYKLLKVKINETQFLLNRK